MWIEISVAIFMWSVNQSRPARALWIEMPFDVKRILEADTSRPARALWIEIPKEEPDSNDTPSRPARALWIEIG